MAVILVVAYGFIKSGSLNRVNEDSQKIVIEVKNSLDSTGFGAVQLVDHNGKEYYCNLIDTNKCDYSFKTETAMKLVSIPAEGSNFDGWLSGCDHITATNLENDTCEINVYKNKRMIEVRFKKL